MAGPRALVQAVLIPKGSSGLQGLHYACGVPRPDRTILYLHGKSGFEGGLEGLFAYPELPSLLRTGVEYDCDVLVPVCHGQAEWSPAAVAQFLDDEPVRSIVRNARYDIVGYSRGGTGGYRVAAHLEARARTLVAVSARPVRDIASRLLHVPVLMVHGKMDQVVPLNDVMALYTELKSEGHTACQLVEFEGDHFIADRVFASPLIPDWQRAHGG